MNSANKAEYRCQHCNAVLTFEAERVGETVVCPNCQMETLLYATKHDTGKSPSKTHFQFLIAGAVISALVTASVLTKGFGLFSKRSPDQPSNSTPKQTAASTPAQVPKRTPEETVERYLKVSQWEQRLEFVRSPEQVRPLSGSPIVSQQYGVICFSAVPDDVLMWAHYTAYNHGIMLEFDPTASLFHGPGFFKVEYDNNRVISEPQAADEISQVAALARRKSRAWENEAEYRLVVPLDQTTKVLSDGGQPIHLLKITPDWIRSLTVGQRAPVEIKAEINKLLRRPELKNLHAHRFKMVMDSEAFRLNRERVTKF